MMKHRLNLNFCIISNIKRSFPSNILHQKLKQSTLSKSQLNVVTLPKDMKMLEQLQIEEGLLRHNPYNWFLFKNGTKEGKGEGFYNQNEDKSLISNDQVKQTDMMEPVIVMGIGGQPKKLLNIPQVVEHNVPTLKRFSGGGTVILDENSILVSLICNVKESVKPIQKDPFPRPIMEWSGTGLYNIVFEKIKEESINILNEHKSIHQDKINFEPLKTKFELRENDYVFGNHKYAGNAQCIVKGRWLHHTSFLWDYKPKNMEYLTLPEKRPEYRSNRNHNDFLIRLKDIFCSDKLKVIMNENDYSDYEKRIRQMVLPAMIHVLSENYQIKIISYEEMKESLESSLMKEGIKGIEEWKSKARTRNVLRSLESFLKVEEETK